MMFFIFMVVVVSYVEMWEISEWIFFLFLFDNGIIISKIEFWGCWKKASASFFSASSFYILWFKATNLEKCFLSVCLSHSGSNWL